MLVSPPVEIVEGFERERVLGVEVGVDVDQEAEVEDPRVSFELRCRKGDHFRLVKPEFVVCNLS